MGEKKNIKNKILAKALKVKYNLVEQSMNGR
jgi:hypothetical protein